METSAKNISVSQAGISHAHAYAALHAACFASAWSSDDFCKFLSLPGTFGLLAAKNDGQDEAIGFALVTSLYETAEILTIGILPQMRRRGAGLAMLTEIHAICAKKEAARVVLEVNTKDMAATSFYAKAGYEKIGERAGYYKHRDASRDDALVLSRAIDKC